MASPEVTGATIEAEESLIGSILLEASAGVNVIPEIRGIVRPDDFYYELCGTVFTAMLNCDLPDIHGVAYELNTTGKLRDHDITFMYMYMGQQGTSLEYIHLAQLVAGCSDTRRGKPRQRIAGVEL